MTYFCFFFCLEARKVPRWYCGGRRRRNPERSAERSDGESRLGAAPEGPPVRDPSMWFGEWPRQIHRTRLPVSKNIIPLPVFLQIFT